ncbi:MAG TPA: CHASE2 domain-containing protein [Rhizomicrobium sp.]|jgi:hypothetical protein
MLLLAAAVEIYIDPMRLHAFGDRYARNLANLIAEVLYGDEGQKHISVALYYDQMWPNGQAEWPVDYQTHAQALDDLRRACPRAVVVDILLLHGKDSTVTKLVDVINRYKNTNCPVNGKLKRYGIPIYILGADYSHQPERGILPQIAQSDSRLVSGQVVQRDGMVSEYPIYTEHCFDTGRVLRKTPRRCASLALQVYCDIVGGSSPMCSPNSNGTDKARLELVWGMLGLSCQPRNALQRFGASFRGILYRPAASLPNCYYHSVLPATALTDKRALRDRVVFYGASIRGLGDVFETPVASQMPGVFIHAMALDNLITLDGRPYVNEFAGLDERSLELLLSVPVLAALAALFVSYLGRKRPAEISDIPAEQRYLREELRSLFEPWWILTLAAWFIVVLIITICLRLSIAAGVNALFLAAEMFPVLIVAGYSWFFLQRVCRRPKKT